MKQRNINCPEWARSMYIHNILIPAMDIVVKEITEESHNDKSFCIESQLVGEYLEKQ